MHLKRVRIFPQRFPTQQRYPFNLDIFSHPQAVNVNCPITFFVGENGTGKSTLLQAISHRCNIYIWQGQRRARFRYNPYEAEFYKAVEVEWVQNTVPGSFFASEIFKNFAQILDEWATMDPGLLDYFGGKSLMVQSHGQSLMSFFKSRFSIKGLYLLDEPETALSPGSLIDLLKLLRQASHAGQAQFIIATHSPILLACPQARIYSFTHSSLKQIGYEETEHFQVYKSFMQDPHQYLKDL
ncbi:MAG: AAA family ATPase [Desulfobacterales bacterium]